MSRLEPRSPRVLGSPSARHVCLYRMPPLCSSRPPSLPSVEIPSESRMHKHWFCLYYPVRVLGGFCCYKNRATREPSAWMKHLLVRAGLGRWQRKVLTVLTALSVVGTGCLEWNVGMSREGFGFFFLYLP